MYSSISNFSICNNDIKALLASTIIIIIILIITRSQHPRGGGTEYALIMPQTSGTQHPSHQISKQATILPRPRRPEEVESLFISFDFNHVNKYVNKYVNNYANKYDNNYVNKFDNMLS